MGERRVHATVIKLSAIAGALHLEPRAARGERDLEGVWTLSTYTAFERSKELKSLVLIPAAAEVGKLLSSQPKVVPPLIKLRPPAGQPRR
jgi:hypothetical protein